MDAKRQPPSWDPAALLELHKASLGGDGSAMTPAMALALTASFGSVERWYDDLAAVTQGCVPGLVVLVFQPREGSLVNQCSATMDASTHDVLLLAMHGPEERPLLNWEAIYGRYQHAVHDSTEHLGAEQGEVPGAQLLDVRRAGVFEAARQMLPTAQWRDPGQVGEWGPALDPEREVVVYCVYGHEVGRTTALRLRAQGFKARFLRGGFDGWQSAGLPLVDKGASA